MIAPLADAKIGPMGRPDSQSHAIVRHRIGHRMLVHGRAPAREGASDDLHDTVPMFEPYDRIHTGRFVEELGAHAL